MLTRPSLGILLDIRRDELYGEELASPARRIRRGKTYLLGDDALPDARSGPPPGVVLRVHWVIASNDALTGARSGPPPGLYSEFTG